MKIHQLSGKDFAIDVGLVIGTIGAIFLFGVAALPLIGGMSGQ